MAGAQGLQRARDPHPRQTSSVTQVEGEGRCQLPAGFPQLQLLVQRSLPQDVQGGREACRPVRKGLLAAQVPGDICHPRPAFGRRSADGADVDGAHGSREHDALLEAKPREGCTGEGECDVCLEPHTSATL